MDSGPVIIVQLKSNSKVNVAHELRKRGFLVLSTTEKEQFTYVATSMSNKLVVKLSLQEDLALKPLKKYSAYHALRLANAGVEIIMRAQSIGAAAAWVAHNPAAAKSLTDQNGNETELTAICNYYGPHIALGFGFVSLNVYYLKGLALVGLIALIEILSNSLGLAAGWLPFYCAYLALWSTYHLQRWKQRRAALSYVWDIQRIEEDALDLEIVKVFRRSFLLLNSNLLLTRLLNYCFYM